MIHIVTLADMFQTLFSLFSHMDPLCLNQLLKIVPKKKKYTIYTSLAQCEKHCSSHFALQYLQSSLSHGSSFVPERVILFHLSLSQPSVYKAVSSWWAFACEVSDSRVDFSRGLEDGCSLWRFTVLLSIINEAKLWGSGSMSLHYPGPQCTISQIRSASFLKKSCLLLTAENKYFSNSVIVTDGSWSEIIFC